MGNPVQENDYRISDPGLMSPQVLDSVSLPVSQQLIQRENPSPSIIFVDHGFCLPDSKSPSFVAICKFFVILISTEIYRYHVVLSSGLITWLYMYFLHVVWLSISLKILGYIIKYCFPRIIWLSETSHQFWDFSSIHQGWRKHWGQGLPHKLKLWPR